MFFLIYSIFYCKLKDNNFITLFTVFFTKTFSAHPPTPQKKLKKNVLFLVVGDLIFTQSIESRHGDVDSFHWKITPRLQTNQMLTK